MEPRCFELFRQRHRIEVLTIFIFYFLGYFLKNLMIYNGCYDNVINGGNQADQGHGYQGHGNQGDVRKEVNFISMTCFVLDVVLRQYEMHGVR